jgi:hypothetical protein
VPINFKVAAAGTAQRLRENKNSEKSNYTIIKYFFANIAPTMMNIRHILL